MAVAVDEVEEEGRESVSDRLVLLRTVCATTEFCARQSARQTAD